MDKTKIDTRLSGMLGFAMRAGRLVLGTEQVCLAMAKAKSARGPKLVLVCEGCSAATHKKLVTKAQFYRIPVYTLPIDGATLGDLLGKTSVTVAVAVMDDGFAKQICIRLGEMGRLTATPEATENTSLRKEVSEHRETGMTDGTD